MKPYIVTGKYGKARIYPHATKRRSKGDTRSVRIMAEFNAHPKGYRLTFWRRDLAAAIDFARVYVGAAAYVVRVEADGIGYTREITGVYSPETAVRGALEHIKGMRVTAEYVGIRVPKVAAKVRECASCEGRGYQPGAFVPCAICKGRGFLTVLQS